MTTQEFDVIFIGAGPGGYVGAIRAAQLGLKTAVIEKRPTFGGTCLNVGCIPSKALLESSELFAMAGHEFSGHGIEVEKPKLNLAQMMARKDKIVKDLTQGIGFLFKKNKITAFTGRGYLKDSKTVEVLDEQGQVIQSLRATKGIVLATGSVPNSLPGVSITEKHVVSSTGALSFEQVPERLIVIGGGVIGLELGSVWARLGSQVEVIEYAAQICPFVDGEVIKVFRRSLEKQGLKFHTSMQVLSVTETETGTEVVARSLGDGVEHKWAANKVLVATGRKPYSEGLGLENVGLKVNARGQMEVDKHFQTAVAGIYAIGDLIPGPMLAHKAEEEGVAVAEILAGHYGHVNYDTCPSVIYTAPEVAWVGPTEETLQAQGVPYRSGKFLFAANGRAKALGQTEGFVKILAHKETDRILAGHIIGPRASELLGEVVVAMEFGGSSEDLARSFHAHPTLNEVIREAALGVDGRIRQS